MEFKVSNLLQDQHSLTSCSRRASLILSVHNLLTNKKVSNQCATFSPSAQTQADVQSLYCAFREY